jgi:hypothetical protein
MLVAGMLDGGMLCRGERQSSRGNGFWGGVISSAPCWANFRSDKNSRQPIPTRRSSARQA